MKPAIRLGAAACRASTSAGTYGPRTLRAAPKCRVQLPRTAWIYPRFASSTSLPPTPSSPSSSSSSSSSSQSPASSQSSQPEVSEDRFSAAASEELLQTPATSRQPLGKVERRLSITFTCTVPDCGHRSTHEFSRHAYEKGIVLVQCPGCESRHLIADHLGWFDSDDLTQGGKYRNIEDLMAAKGETVARATVQPNGTIEVDTPAEGEAEEQTTSGDKKA